ncbi:transcriptional regulator [Desulfomonile tiedjei]|uniref:Putative transcriptional regulator containing an HTH domain fused to a Zn-ribbon n=1 Tax=Desulfomonile tiedjei (strain ATCC 49306 / DSM 6799 / DCB-1) TaxID=706587 RepID=I4C0I1_DESTA|nr:transcriptional regulator [Desulfomonile tiedjei]AFM23072.1 putative transcriptional regulator containing an HTH domain fused to a Zn-ribbon [Desulfomonile tiedjei DSM 6799]
MSQRADASPEFSQVAPEDILTIRKRIAQLLKAGEFTARDISRILHISEKEVYEHLPHVEKSLGNEHNLIAKPAACLDCGFVFKKRTRFTTPGKCPVCKSEGITPPIFGTERQDDSIWEEDES